MSSPESSLRDAENHLFEFSGGALCLDFANTVGDRPRFDKDHLLGYSDLISWARQAEILDDETAGRLESAAGERPVEVEGIFAAAVELRENLYRIFSRLADGARPATTDLALLNRWLAESLSHLELEDDGKTVSWAWSGLDADLERMLWPVVRSAADLLTSDEADRVRECASGTCSWLFVDRSRTHRRRWCDMKTCGNRDKARRYYQRQRAAKRAAS